MGNSATGSGTNLDKILWARLADHEKMFVANGTVGARALFTLGASGAVQATANSLAVVGANATSESVSTTLYFPGRCFGITPVVAAQKINIGAAVKAGHSGRVAQMIDASLISTALGGGQYTLQAGGNYGNQPAGDTVDVVSAGAGDIGQTVTVYGSIGGVQTSEVFTLNGVVEDTGAVAMDLVHAVIISAAHAGTVTVHEHSGGLAVTTLATGILSSGRLTASDPRAYYGLIGVVASGACTKYVSVLGKSLTGAAQGEVLQMNGAVLVPSTLEYSEVTYIDVGDVAAATNFSATVDATEDNIGTRIGKALTAASAEGVEFYIKLSP